MNKWFFALLPPNHIISEIQEIQFELKESHGFSHALKTPPHITLVPPFSAKEDQVLSFIHSLSNETFDSFTIQLNGFEAFYPRVIFIDVEENFELITFSKQLKVLFAKENIIANKGEKHFFTPHITIVNRDLNNKKFKELFPFFQKRQYTASFDVHSIFLLKQTHERTWEQHKEIKFRR